MDAPDPYGMNVSDDEREHVIGQLREALEAGRLSLAEFERRSGEAYAAASYGDLNRVLDDLPGSSPARSPGPYRYDPYGMQYPTAPPPMPVPAPYGAYPPGRPPENGFGVAGLVLGIIGVCCLPCAILGIIFGALGLGKANRGEADNRGMAMAGLVLGIVGVALIVIRFPLGFIF
ncbi:DUF1707 and DUF4190 domain-containing protein [Glycomyces xiaoerkulensis]|uniref:DUF1707 and DUF4190 domain-containing protein n=1 Tax=Glycomyces xiaoerkulensis TaxID=2038139 RepID=UPI000C26415C|nr:DUF1707 and DUF4190 domain-containing protein [Glycomyces xiaoerkulensis]